MDATAAENLRTLTDALDPTSFLTAARLIIKPVLKLTSILTLTFAEEEFPASEERNQKLPVI